MNWLNEDQVKTENNDNILNGSDNIMNNFNIILPPETEMKEEYKNSLSVYVAVNRELAGYVLLKDPVRENAKKEEKFLSV